jgi:hypothetical protein
VELYPEHRQIKKVKLTIAQPTSREPIRSVEYAINDVFPRWMQELRGIVQAALAPGAPRVPGKVQCRYCAAADTCKERRQAAVQTMFEAFSPEEKPVQNEKSELRTQEGQNPGLSYEESSRNWLPEKPVALGPRCRDSLYADLSDLDDIGLPDDSGPVIAPLPGDPVIAEEPPVSMDSVLDLAETATSQDPGEMDPVRLGRILDLAPIIEGFLKSCEKAALARISEGKGVPGWKLVNGQRSRTWNSSEEETENALKALGLGVREVYTRKLISPAQGEKLPKIATSKVRLKKLGELWHWKEGKPMLAPEADPRPEVRSASEMFESIESDPFEGLE